MEANANPGCSKGNKKQHKWKGPLHISSSSPSLYSEENRTLLENYSGSQSSPDLRMIANNWVVEDLLIHPLPDESQNDELWVEVKRQWEVLHALVDGYAEEMKIIMKEKKKYSSESQANCQSIGELADCFYPIQRHLCFTSGVKELLKSYRVFLCHAGPQKPIYVDYVYKKLEKKGIDVFFDYSELNPSCDRDLQIIYAEVTCQIEVVVES